MFLGFGDPGVSLRFTPGFMLTPAPRTYEVLLGCADRILLLILGLRPGHYAFASSPVSTGST